MYVIEALTQANDEEVRYAAKKTMFVLEEQEKRVKGIHLGNTSSL